MKKLYSILIIFLFSLFVTRVDALDLHSKNVILYNLNDDKVIYEENSKDKVAVASLTKIMTAIITLENIKDLDTKVILKDIDFNTLIQENLVTAGFINGEEVTYRDLLYGLLLPSGADAADALTKLVGKTETEFVQMMNDKVKELKLPSTHFENAIGLDDDKNYSSAKDMATLFQYALKNKDFYKIITTDNYKTSNGRLTIYSSVKRNGNNLQMDYLLGGKTGTTDNAGLCLATIAEKNNIKYMLVTTGAPYDKKGPHHFEDAKTIYEYFMNNYGYQKVIKKDDEILSLETKYTKRDKVIFKAKEDISYYLPNNYNKEKIKYKYDGEKIITSKMKKGETLGDLTIFYDNEKISTLKILLDEKQKFSLIKYLQAHFIVVIVILLVIIWLTYTLLKLKKHKRKHKKYKKRP